MKYCKCVWLLVICSIPFGCFAFQVNHDLKNNEDLTAENMILWQRSNGGWAKDTYTVLNTDVEANATKKKLSGKKALVDYSLPQTDYQKKLALASKDFKDATIDNKATVKEIRHLLKAYTTTQNKKYLHAAEQGISYLLTAQYANGGWPQFYPDNSHYRGYITFNDNAMINVMNLMLDLVSGTAGTNVVAPELKSKAAVAFNNGVDVIVKTQIKTRGKLTVWCAQHDDKTLVPAKARSFELPSFSGAESAGIVRLLMRIENPSQQVKTAITSAIDWFNESKIVGYKTLRIKDTTQPTGNDVILVADPASVIWARFYDLETNQPFFCGRDGVKKSALAQIENERRAGYSWYGVWPLKLLSDEFPAWQKKYN